MRTPPALRKHLGLAVSVLMASAWLVSCSDDPAVEPNTVSETSAVFGRVSTQASGIEVSLWQTDLVHKTDTDAAGFFQIYGVRAGEYSLLAREGDQVRRAIETIAVGDGSIDLGELIVSKDLLDPFWEVLPIGDSVLVPDPGFAIRLRTYRRLDLNSLGHGVTIEPTIAGAWVPRVNHSSGLNTYLLLPEGSPEPGTTYEVTATSAVLLESGVSWGSELTFGFETVPFGIQAWNWDEDALGGRIDSGHIGEIVRFEFTNVVDADSVPGAVGIEPNGPIESLLLGSRTVVVRALGKLSPSTEYELTIGSGVLSLNGVPSTTPIALTLTTN